jgi:predicted secreted protein
MGNTVKNRDYVLSLSTDSGTTFNPIAGIRTKNLTRENPIADETNQATTGNETEACYTGYSTVTLSAAAVSDVRTASLTALNSFIATANGSDPTALLKLENAALGTYEGTFIITSFSGGGEQNGLVEFDFALQNEGAITFTAGV